MSLTVCLADVDHRITVNFFRLGSCFYQLKREASKIGIQLVSKPSLTIGSLLCSKAKHHLPKLQESNVVYKIECSCQVDGDPVVYIGETDRNSRELQYPAAKAATSSTRRSCGIP
ncbi:hypothetical protein FJT64_025960 [Amphibalanus amphitrite]|uniref:Uncharacterized protein n=1 Tax=Amphibalanus amphitrite TaxID=1232801 RepID=A0A6A4WG79_AMPAM|nr:hypothetical protein FJT64_025960 [Amphibalanus amphitrite]